MKSLIVGIVTMKPLYVIAFLFSNLFPLHLHVLLCLICFFAIIDFIRNWIEALWSMLFDQYKLLKSCSLHLSRYPKWHSWYTCLCSCAISRVDLCLFNRAHSASPLMYTIWSGLMWSKYVWIYFILFVSLIAILNLFIYLCKWRLRCYHQMFVVGYLFCLWHRAAGMCFLCWIWYCLFYKF